MEVQVNEELKGICRDIIGENKSAEQWKQSGSGELYQTDNYCGGYEASKGLFSFSLYKDDKEYWFDLNLSEVSEIAEGNKKSIQCEEVDP